MNTFVSISINRWLRLTGVIWILVLLLAAHGVTRASAAGLAAIQHVAGPTQGPAVVIITNMSARPGASPFLVLALFALLSLLFGVAWLTRRGDQAT